MENSKIKKAAETLYNARIRKKRIIELPKDCIPESIKEAYDIQDELTNKYISTDKNILLMDADSSESALTTPDEK